MTALTLFLAAEAAKAGLPEGTPAGYFSPIVAGVGFVTGWMVLGTLTGRGYGNSMGLGLRTAVTAVFWALLGFSLWHMIELSMKMRYDGPMQALLDVFALMVENGRLVILPDVLVALGVGGALTGLFAEWAGRRWN
ncbi:MAG: TrgA family protein [Gemmobacter sp.]